MRSFTFVLIITSGLFFLFSCTGSSRKVARIAVDQTTDISGRWNDSDARMTAGYMVKDLLSRHWLADFTEENDKKPILVVGKIQNRTSEHLDATVFIREIEKELLNSGEVRFVASGKGRKSIRKERMEQQSYASVESAKELANEQAADFMLTGTIVSVEDTFDGEKTVFYKVSLELIDVENNVKVWVGNKDIKKQIHQDKYRW